MSDTLNPDNKTTSLFEAELREHQLMAAQGQSLDIWNSPQRKGKTVVSRNLALAKMLEDTELDPLTFPGGEAAMEAKIRYDAGLAVLMGSKGHITAETLLKAHEQMMGPGVDSGRLRNEPVWVTVPTEGQSVRWNFPDPSQLDSLMLNFEEIQARGLQLGLEKKVIGKASADLLKLIHPFVDCNGRIATAVEAFWDAQEEGKAPTVKSRPDT